MRDSKLMIAMPCLRSGIACALIAIGATLGTLVGARDATATSLYTYSFTQSGYFLTGHPDQDVKGWLTGTFSFAAVPSTGIVGKADLVDFSYDFQDSINGHPPVDLIQGDASDFVGIGFSFYPKGASSLFLQVHDNDTGRDLCVGGAASFALCGLPPNYVGEFAFTPTPGDQEYAFLVTSLGPQVTLISAPTPPVVTPPVATTPIPPTLPLFASSLGAIGFAGWRRRVVNRLRRLCA